MLPKGIYKITFWARELRLPLFFLSNKSIELFANDMLILYKNSVIHVYYLNDRDKKTAGYGYKFFTNNGNIKNYKKQVQQILKEIEKTKQYFNNIKIKNLSNSQLKSLFFNNILKTLVNYSNIYMKTEDFFLFNLEKEASKHESLIIDLSKLRFILRKEGEVLFYFLLGVVLKEISRRFQVKVKDLFFYNNQEIIKIFNGKKVSHKILEERSRGYLFYTLKGKPSLITGKKFKKIYKEMLSVKKVNKLIGKTAMKGKASGKVRILLHNKKNILKEVFKFKKGEILVTEMTRPDTILACKKAAAIITDEGGLLSHAAIVSRELGVPCVIGTKIATQLLKDGDLVEVDADKGIVRIIK
ncbi:MAG: PEP-utilizing enzyme [archaeon]